jgi:hypothetical protein
MTTIQNTVVPQSSGHCGEGWPGFPGIRTIEGNLLHVGNTQKSSLSAEAILLKAEIMYLTV